MSLSQALNQFAQNLGRYHVNPSKPLNFNEITRLSINAHFSV